MFGRDSEPALKSGRDETTTTDSDRNFARPKRECSKTKSERIRRQRESGFYAFSTRFEIDPAHANAVLCPLQRQRCTKMYVRWQPPALVVVNSNSIRPTCGHERSASTSNSDPENEKNKRKYRQRRKYTITKTRVYITTQKTTLNMFRPLRGYVL